MLAICLIIQSCQPLGDCKLFKDAIKGDECLLLVREILGKADGRFNYKGINPINKKECDCNSSTGSWWWSEYNDYIQIGDTILKKKGELVFSIHKKDTVLTFNYECQGVIYK